MHLSILSRTNDICFPVFRFEPKGFTMPLTHKMYAFGLFPAHECPPVSEARTPTKRAGSQRKQLSAQVPSQSLQSSGAFTLAAAPTSLPVPQPSGALTVLAAAFPHRPHCSPSLKMGEDSGEVRRRDDAATTKRRRRRDVMTVLENLTLWFRVLQVPDQSIRGRDLQRC